MKRKLSYKKINLIKRKYRIKDYLRSILKFNFIFKQFLAVNAHLGYEIKYWNNQMRFFIYGQRNSFHILNLHISILMLKRICVLINSILKVHKNILFISENKNIDIILQKIIMSSKQFITCKRWLGGTISNFFIIYQNISIFYKRIKNVFKMQNYFFKNYFLLKNNNLLRKKINKKLIYFLKLLKKTVKYQFMLDGIYGLRRLPKLVIILNGVKSKWALNEIMEKKLCCGVILDSLSILHNNLITFPIPGNSFSFSTQVFLCSVFKINILNSLLHEKLFLKLNLNL